MRNTPNDPTMGTCRIQRWRLDLMRVRVERCRQVRLYTLARWYQVGCTLQRPGAQLTTYTIWFEVIGLSRRSAVVRGAVDTGCRRNHNSQPLFPTLLG